MISRSAVVGDVDFAFLDAVRFTLPAHEVASRDLQLLVSGVAGEADDLHAVAQRPGDGVEEVCRREKHDAAQVERHAEIIVAEGVVLLGVEDFEKRR